jgi:hypothetical protein
MEGASSRLDADLLAALMQDEGAARRLHDAQLGDRPAAAVLVSLAGLPSRSLRRRRDAGRRRRGGGLGKLG